MTKNTRGLLSIAVLFFVIVPDVAVSQGIPTTDRNILERLSTLDKLIVELKNGKTVKGSFRALTDTSMTLSSGNRTAYVDRQDIRKVYRVTGRPVGKSTLKGTVIGAGAGAVLGAAVGEECGRQRSGIGVICFNRAATIPIGAAIFAVPGAIIGLVLGAFRHNRQLIYES